MNLRLSTCALAAGLAAVWITGSVARSAPDGRQTEYFNGVPAVAGEVLVKLGAGADLASLHQQADADDDEPVGSAGWRRLKSASHGVQALVALMHGRRDVVAVEPNYVVQATAIPNDPQFSSLWGLLNGSRPGTDIHATGAWDVSTGSASVVIGGVDTGVDYTHPDLAANMWSAPSSFTVTVGGSSITCPAGSHGFNAVAFTCDPADDNGHGTHTAGTMGAVGNNGVGVVGVNWTTRLMALKFMDSTGSGTTSDAINAIEFAIRAKNALSSSNGANVRVLSNSWGGSGFSQALLNEIQNAANADMLFVAAAGNSSSNNDVSPTYPASYAAANVVAVAATDSNDALASFSNWGATSVQLGAPGVNILSTWPGGQYATLQGTSMAAPHVSGAAALVLSACSLTTAQVKSAILNNVDVVSGLTGIVSTNGRLNVDRAVRSCAPSVPTVTLTSPVSGATYTAPATIALAATASSSNGIAKVEFYAGTTLVGTATTSPYTASWTNVAAGSYTLTAKAYDTVGATATSAGTAVTVSSAATGLPTPWVGQDIGAVGAAGAASATGGTFTVRGSGADIWGTADAFQFVYQPLMGDGQIIARVATVQNTDAWAKAGVMIREDLTPGSRHASMFVTPGSGVSFQRRTTTNGLMTHTTIAGAAPAWVKVVRSGSTLSGYVSADGTTWTLVGSDTVAMATTVYVGLAVTSHNYGVLCAATFDNVMPSAGGAPAPSVPSVTLTSPASGATYTAPATIALAATASSSNGIAKVEFYAGTTLVGTATTSPYTASWTNVAAGSYTLTAKAYDTVGATATSAGTAVTVSSAATGLPTPWVGQDIGAVGAAGTASATGGTFTVRGSGADIWGTADAFQFVYQPLMGDGQIIARVATVQNTDAWAKAGVMIREDLTAGSRHASMFVTPGSGVSFQRRTTANGLMTHTTIAGAAPAWVKVVRSGSTLSGYVSADGTTWTLVGSDTVAMATTAYIGLAVTSHNYGVLCTATLDSVTK